MSSATDLPGPVQEIQKRAAKVNTQLRFKKHDEALKLALELRLHIQTCGYEHPAVEDELKGVEAAIRQLERRRFGYYRYLTQLFLKALFDAFRTKSAEQSDDAASSADADAVVPQAEQVEAEAINPARMARDDGAVNPAQMAAQQKPQSSSDGPPGATIDQSRSDGSRWRRAAH